VARSLLKSESANKYRSDATLRLILIEHEKIGPLAREVTIPDDWTDEETFKSWADGLRDLIWEAIDARVNGQS